MRVTFNNLDGTRSGSVNIDRGSAIYENDNGPILEVVFDKSKQEFVVKLLAPIVYADEYVKNWLRKAMNDGTVT